MLRNRDAGWGDGSPLESLRFHSFELSEEGERDCRIVAREMGSITHFDPWSNQCSETASVFVDALLSRQIRRER